MATLKEIFEDLDTYERECNYENWDGEGAWPTHPAIVASAKLLLEELLEAALFAKRLLKLDSGGPASDGGVCLQCDGEQRYTLVFMEHDGRYGVVRGWHDERERPTHEYLSREDAIKAMLWAGDAR